MPAPGAGAEDGGALSPPQDSLGGGGDSAGSGGSTGNASGSAGESGNTGSPEDGGTSGTGGTPWSEGGNAGAEIGGASGESGSGGSGSPPLDCVEFTLPADCPETSLEFQAPVALPTELRCTGLYGDFATRTRACGVREYVPAYELWSDGASKHRYVALPPGTSVDGSDPDNWTYPVGTQFWKEFWVGDGEKRLGETRLLRKHALGWLYTSYVWSEDGASAVQTNAGVVDLFGTGHTVPTRDQCRGCHSGRPDFILGWDPVLLGEGARGITREGLVEQGALIGLSDAALAASIPGNPVERAALGYLHANCGVACHNLTEEATGRSSTLFLRLDVATLGQVSTTHAVETGLNEPPATDAAIPPEKPEGPYYNLRPLDPERSLIIERMQRRGDDFAMPRFGTNIADPAGLEAVTRWIEQMTEANGYPPAEP